MRGLADGDKAQKKISRTVGDRPYKKKKNEQEKKTRMKKYNEEEGERVTGQRT